MLHTLGTILGVIGALILLAGFITGCQELWRIIGWASTTAKIVRWDRDGERDGAAKPVLAFSHDGTAVEATSYLASNKAEVAARPAGSDAAIRYRPKQPEVVEFKPPVRDRLWPLWLVLIGLAVAIVGIKLP